MRRPKGTKAACLFSDRDLRWETLDRRRAEETIQAQRVLDHPRHVCGLGDGATVAKHEHITTLILSGLDDAPHEVSGVRHRHGPLCADRTLGRQTRMSNEQIGSRACHFARLFLVEYVRAGQQPEFVCAGDHFDFGGEPHPGFLKVHPEHSVNKAYSWKVLNARETDLLELAEKAVH